MCFRTIAVLCVLAVGGVGRGATGEDCYFKEKSNAWVVGNSKVEIRIDIGNGAITGLLNKASGVEYIGKGTHEAFVLVYSTWAVHGADPNDLWSAAWGMPVHGSTQKVAFKQFDLTANGARLEIGYDRLNLERRTINVAVKYSIELKSGDEETKWRLSIQNNDEGIVREAHFPFACGLSKQDWLIMPNHSGQRIVDPIEKLSDEMPVIWLEYPGRGSMQWFEYYSPKVGLYMASYDKGLEYTQLCFGRAADRDAGMWIVKYPFAAKGTAWQSPDLAVGIHAGDWHWGADRYRTWLATWTKPPEVAKSVAEMVSGGGGLYIKDMNGHTRNTYEDIVSTAEKLPAGAMTMLVGWFYNGHDTYYPEYIPIPDLGGTEVFLSAIDKVHAMWRRVGAYVNGRLANIETETYEKNGKRWSVLTKAPQLGVNRIEFAELHENWNDEWDKHKRGEGWFAVMCPTAKGWQDHIVGECVRITKDYHIDGIFLDQPGSYYAELCYSPWHGHSTPATAWGQGYLEIFRRIREEMRKMNPNSVLWTEGMNDAYAQYMDYGLDKNPVWEPMRTHPQAETFVEMWRYTMPMSPITNGPGTYSLPASKDRVYGENYKFVTGVRGIRPLRDDADGISQEDIAKNKAVVEKISRLWAKGSEFFFRGRFIDDVGLKVSNPSVFARAYHSEKGVAVALWNTSAEAATCDVTIDLEATGRLEGKISEVVSLNTDQPLPHQVKGSTVTAQVRELPHDIDAIVITTQ